MRKISQYSSPSRISLWSFARSSFVLVVLIGYGFTASRFASLSLEYFLLNSCSVSAFIVLAWILDAPVRQLPACIIAIIFLVCYYFEFYLLVIFPWLLEFVPLPPNIQEFSIQHYFACYVTMTAGLTAFAIVVVLWHLFSWRRPSGRDDEAVPAEYNMKPALLVAGALAAAYLGFNSSYNVVASGAQPNVDYHLFGVVEFSFSITASILLLMVIDNSRRTRDASLTFFAYFIWMTPLLYTMFIITSKGAIFIFAIELLFLWLLEGGKLNWPIAISGGVCIALGVILFPVINAIRALRVDDGVSAAQAVSLLLGGSNTLFATLRTVPARNDGSVGVVVFEQVLGRLTGANVLLPIIELGYPMLGWKTVRIAGGMHGITGYFTSQMLGLGELAAEKISAAEGLLGIFFIIGGNAAVIVGVACFVSVVFIIWNMLPKFTEVSTRAAQVSFLMLVASVSLDGSVQQMIFHVLPFWAASVALSERLGRSGRKRLRTAH